MKIMHGIVSSVGYLFKFDVGITGRRACGVLSVSVLGEVDDVAKFVPRGGLAERVLVNIGGGPTIGKRVNFLICD